MAFGEKLLRTSGTCGMPIDLHVDIPVYIDRHIDLYSYVCICVHMCICIDISIYFLVAM